MIIIARDEDSEAAVQELVKNQYRVTRMASTGGFLRRGNSTLLVGVEDEQIDSVIALLRAARLSAGSDDTSSATVFVVNMPYYAKI
jgi:uncharacterized protein YaaQ